MRDSEVFNAVIGDALASGTLVRFRAEGDSMYPTIRDGETIAVAAVSAAAVAHGDVLLVRHGTRVLAHRLVRVTGCGTERFFELRGDAKAGCDSLVAAAAIVGKVVHVHRHGRVVRLSGPAARVRRAARAAASRLKVSMLRTAAALFAVSSGHLRD